SGMSSFAIANVVSTAAPTYLRYLKTCEGHRAWPRGGTIVGIAEPETAVESIEATLNYFLDTGEKPFTATGGAGSLDVRTGGGQDPRRVEIRNGRREAADFTLDRNGFRFVPHATKVTNFFDEAELRATYYPEMEALVKAQSGASRVVVFDHTLRTADDEAREARKIREVVRRVHN